MLEITKFQQQNPAQGDIKLILKAPDNANLVSKVAPKAAKPEMQVLQPIEKQTNESLFHIY